MIKVFLVEDEIVIRNGIKRGIQWEEEGMEFVGEASDGEMAFPLIRKTKPDILITDIRMPFMNGLELSRTVLKELPETKILILSGYGEFDYAQEALRIGVQEYLLKPVSSTKLLGAVKDIIGVIEKEREEKELLKRYSLEMEESKQRKIQDFFDRLVTEQVPMAEALAEGHLLGMELVAESYNIILFKLRLKEHEMEYSEQVVAAEREIRSYVASQSNVYVYERGAEGLGFLIKGNGKEEMAHSIREFCSNLVALTNVYEGVEYYAAVGKSVDRLRELGDSYHEANKAFSSRFAEEWNRIVSGGGIYVNETMDIDIHSVYSVENTRKMVQQFLHSGTLDEVGSFIEGYFGNVRGENLKSLMMRQYICMDIYFSVIAFGEEIGVCREALVQTCGEINGLSEHIGNLEKTMKYVQSILQGVILLRDSAAGRKYSDILAKAQYYIKEHYMEDDMSLNRLASYVNMSPSYFSSIFSQESGQTFVEYLTEVRMEKAKELLMCSNQKISEIVYQVGYKNSHYFNYIFKKTQNCSPREYRSRGKELASKNPTE